RTGHTIVAVQHLDCAWFSRTSPPEPNTSSAQQARRRTFPELALAWKRTGAVMRIFAVSFAVLSIASILAGCTTPVAQTKSRTPVSQFDSRDDLRDQYRVI